MTGSRTPINGFVGGFCCGVVAGIKKQRSRLAIGYGLGFGVAGAALRASGGHMSQLSEQFNERKAFSARRSSEPRGHAPPPPIRAFGSSSRAHVRGLLRARARQRAARP